MALRLVNTLPKCLFHAEARHHLPGNIGSAVEVIRSAGRNLLEDQFLRCASAHEHRHAIEKLASLDQETVLGWPLHGVAQRADAARNDRHFMNGINARQRGGDERMAHLVIGHHLLSFGLRTRERFSMPATRRSTARVKSSIVTSSPPRRVADRAASFTRLANPRLRNRA